MSWQRFWNRLWAPVNPLPALRARAGVIIVGALLLLGLTVAGAIYARSRATKAADLVPDLRAKWLSLLTAPYFEARNNRAKTREIERIVLPSLERFSTNRFLWSQPLAALQGCTMTNIEVTELLGTHSLTMSGEDTAALRRPISFRATSITEIVTLTLRGRDFAPDAERNHIKFMDCFMSNQYFRERLRKTRPYEMLGTKTPGEPAAHRPGVFAFRCYFEPKTRTTCN